MVADDELVCMVQKYFRKYYRWLCEAEHSFSLHIIRAMADEWLWL
jgi:hypothetical protein